MDFERRSPRDMEDEIAVLEESKEDDMMGIRARLAAKRAGRDRRRRNLAVLADHLNHVLAVMVDHSGEEEQPGVESWTSGIPASEG